jgi:thymidylate synthase (FAD)
MAEITVELLDRMGTDLTVVNSAKVSFDKLSTEVGPREVRLINFLARGCESGKWEDYVQDLIDPASCFTHEQKEDLVSYLRKMPTHWTPFGHPQIQLRETVPIFVARQRFKHKVGFVENEVSRRYVDSTPDFFVPDVWRKRAADKKQGSSNEVIETMNCWGVPKSIQWHYEGHVQDSLDLYESLLSAGVCPEQARMVLPQSMMTSYVVTGSLYAFASLYNARTYEGAQVETKDLALKIGAIIEPLFPVSWRALTK